MCSFYLYFNICYDSISSINLHYDSRVSRNTYLLCLSVLLVLSCPVCSFVVFYIFYIADYCHKAKRLLCKCTLPHLIRIVYSFGVLSRYSVTVLYNGGSHSTVSVRRLFL